MSSDSRRTSTTINTQFCRLLSGFCILTAIALAQPESATRALIEKHAAALRFIGVATVIQEARDHDFFLLGELHGENEIPALVSQMWPQLWASGYRHVAAEVSPWAAGQLEQSTARTSLPIRGLWNQDQVTTVRQFASPAQHVLWGCDTEEGQPDRLIAPLAAANPQSSELAKMLTIAGQQYERKTGSRTIPHC